MEGIKRVLTAMILMLLIASASALAEGSLPVIKDIRVIATGDNLGVEVSADNNLEYSCYKMPQLLRVVIDFPNTEPGRAETIFKVKSTMISTIKIQKKSINGVMITRVIVNLAEDADFTAQTDPSDKKKMMVVFRKPTSPSAESITAKLDHADLAKKSASRKPSLPVVASSENVSNSTVPVNDAPVIVNQVSFTADSIDIQADGLIREFKSFTLRDPERLVVDIPAASSKLGTIAVPPNGFGIVTVRIGNYPGKLRLVFEAGQRSLPAHTVLKTAKGLRVEFPTPPKGKK